MPNSFPHIYHLQYCWFFSLHFNWKAADMGDVSETQTTFILAFSPFPFIWGTILLLSFDFGSELMGSGRLFHPLYHGFCYKAQLLTPFHFYTSFSSSTPHFSQIFFMHHLTLAYAVKAQLLYPSATLSLPVHWILHMLLHIEDNSTGTEFLPYVKGTGGRSLLTKQPAFHNTNYENSRVFFLFGWL